MSISLSLKLSPVVPTNSPSRLRQTCASRKTPGTMRSVLSSVEASWACDVRTKMTDKKATAPDPVIQRIPYTGVPRARERYYSTCDPRLHDSCPCSSLRYVLYLVPTYNTITNKQCLEQTYSPSLPRHPRLRRPVRRHRRYLCLQRRQSFWLREGPQRRRVREERGHAPEQEEAGGGNPCGSWRGPW